jgi:hypothetical protein
MPFFPIPGASGRYALIAFDANGTERVDDPDGLMSQRVLGSVASDSITDVFVASHGWRGDLQSARKQYDSWVGAMAACQADRQRAEQQGHMRPLVIGLHWPSEPWGDEEFASPAVSFSADGPSPIEAEIDAYAKRIADTSEARSSLHTIFAAALRDPSPARLPQEVRDAYDLLQQEAGLFGEGTGGPPGADGEPFDAEQRYLAARQSAVVSFGMPTGLSDLLSPLRMISFWKMKDRARKFGESGGHTFLRALQGVRADLRVHLMGHSFGCIVVSASLGGPPGGGPGTSRPVKSLVLVQGALSLWSYCADIPDRPGRPGYFHPLVAGKLVDGPTVTTRSRFDTAVGRWYPLAAGIAGQVDFAPQELPRYGGVGTFGLRGPGLEINDLELKAADQPYDLRGARVFNLECSWVIRNGDGASGAHSDLIHPELAHVVWSAAHP